MNQSQRPKESIPPNLTGPPARADVLRLVSNGESIMAVARRMGISDGLIHAWRKSDKKAGPPKRGKETDQDLQQEVDTLRKQLLYLSQWNQLYAIH
ncbi:hypothetical protein BH09BAC4_BH09BAC4_13920 [soil metagenome]